MNLDKRVSRDMALKLNRLNIEIATGYYYDLQLGTLCLTSTVHEDSVNRRDYLFKNHMALLAPTIQEVHNYLMERHDILVLASPDIDNFELNCYQIFSKRKLVLCVQQILGIDLDKTLENGIDYVLDNSITCAKNTLNEHYFYTIDNVENETIKEHFPTIEQAIVSAREELLYRRHNSKSKHSNSYMITIYREGKERYLKALKTICDSLLEKIIEIVDMDITPETKLPNVQISQSEHDKVSDIVYNNQELLDKLSSIFDYIRQDKVVSFKIQA